MEQPWNLNKTLMTSYEALKFHILCFEKDKSNKAIVESAGRKQNIHKKHIIEESLILV